MFAAQDLGGPALDGLLVLLSGHKGLRSVAGVIRDSEIQPPLRQGRRTRV